MNYFRQGKKPYGSTIYYPIVNKIIITMKLTLFLVLFFTAGLLAASKGQEINLSVKDYPLEKVLSEIGRQTKFKFLYNNLLLRESGPVSIQVRNASLDEVLQELLVSRRLSYKKIARTITISRSTAKDQVLNAQEDIIVSGTVSDSIGVLSGVSVVVKDRPRSGTMTDANGKFTLKAPADGTLIFRYVGFIEQSIPVKGNTRLDVVLRAAQNLMTEVVVTALGISKEKRQVTYAIQEVKGESLKVARESNVAANLVGKIAGLQIQTKSTLFENPEINLRGESTTIVIDGVPAPAGFDMWSLNADDIENVTVLKGTASSALYGSLAQNGAIMITTKKGKGGASGIELSYNSSTQFQAGFLRIPKTQHDYGMGFNGQYAFVDGKGGGLNDDYGYVWGPKLNQPDASTASGFVEITQYNSPTDPKTGKSIALPWIRRNKDNLQGFLNNGLLTTHNLSFAGTTDRADYRISVSQMYQKGQVPGTKLNSSTLNLAGSLKISDKLKAEATLSYNKQYSPNYPNSEYSPDNSLYNITLWMGPEVDIMDLKNYWKPGRKGLEQFTYNYSWYNNPWFLAGEKVRAYTNDVIVAQANMKYDFNKDLKFMIRGGITNSQSGSDNKIPYSYINYGTDAAPFGNYNLSKNNTMRFITDALLTYNKSFLKDFNVTASLGASSRLDQQNGLSSETVGGLSVPEWYNLANSRGPVKSTNTVKEKQVYGVYGYVDLSYKNMVTLSLTGRNDWTSALEAPHNSYFYPSASLSLIVSEMVKLPEVVSFVKLRGALTNATTDVEPYSTLTSYTVGTRWAGKPSLSLPEKLLAPGLKPNKTIAQEYGTEIRFLKNRIGLDFTYFNYDLINNVVPIPLSLATGYSSTQTNGDKYRRRGIEVVLSGNPIKTKDFSWNIVANYSRLRKTVVEYYGGQEIRNGIKVGERRDTYRGYVWQRSPDGQIVHEGGIPQYVNQVVNMGYTDPDWEFGVGNNFSYRNFGLSFSFDGRIGGKMRNGLEAKMYEGGMHPATANSYRDDAYAGKKTFFAGGVQQTGGNVTYDAQGKITSDTRTFAPNTTGVNYIDWVFATYTNSIDEAVLYDRTFVKLREVTLSYQMPASMLKKTPFKGMSLSVVGRNLMLWSKVPYMDPESYINFDLAEPTTRNIGFNLNLKF
uniref:SusC/RagA family TonB-linked outer membrane protein n=1 Tax=Pedobacter schmidteae TaxID=2201271 RepID=UPI000EB17065|nr:SusC/RagA family TonB-linked outer membrane protein [Pedobacter schmidteae]